MKGITSVVVKIVNITRDGVKVEIEEGKYGIIPESEFLKYDIDMAELKIGEKIDVFNTKKSRNGMRVLCFARKDNSKTYISSILGKILTVEEMEREKRLEEERKKKELALLEEPGWNEAKIRKEMARLDAKTGLNGAKLDIKFIDIGSVLGRYNSVGFFEFSKKYFEDPEWPEELALDTIRHEYAHYADHMIYGNCSHGKTWKKCCIEVGAKPLQYYNPNSPSVKYYKNKYAEDAKLEARFSEYSKGDHIQHPKYGRGIIKVIIENPADQCAIVYFKSVGIKKLSMKWVVKNCKKCS